MTKAQILVVEDEGIVALNVQSSLESLGYDVPVVVSSGEEAIEEAERTRPDLVLMDIMLEGDIDGVEAAGQIRERFNIPVVYLTAYADDETLQRARITEPFGYLLKPFEERELHTTIEMALYKHKAEEERRKLIEELDAFAHTVAHDLKSPLFTIVGFAGILEEDYATMPDEEMRDCLQTIVRGGHKAVSIIDELLLLAGVRKEKVEMGPLGMASIVADAQQRLAHLIEEHQAEIVLPDTWPAALGYGPWVEEVWVNYLSNAIKYGGQPPRVELGASPPLVSLARGGKAKGGRMVCFWVRDNGPGLTAEEQARLFTPFTRLDQVRTKGHGLGLSIARRTVEKLGGQVGVQSQVGCGSVFTFTLPAMASEQ
jgi:two-component system sensor histidine kinase/response regulator